MKAGDLKSTVRSPFDAPLSKSSSIGALSLKTTVSSRFDVAKKTAQQSVKDVTRESPLSSADDLSKGGCRNDAAPSAHERTVSLQIKTQETGLTSQLDSTQTQDVFANDECDKQIQKLKINTSGETHKGLDADIRGDTKRRLLAAKGRAHTMIQSADSGKLEVTKQWFKGAQIIQQKEVIVTEDESVDMDRNHNETNTDTSFSLQNTPDVSSHKGSGKNNKLSTLHDQQLKTNESLI